MSHVMISLIVVYAAYKVLMQRNLPNICNNSPLGKTNTKVRINQIGARMVEDGARIAIDKLEKLRLKFSRCTQGSSQDFSKGESHCVKHYRHGVFATKYCRLFA